MLNYCKKINSIEEIEDISYCGYFWISDESKPQWFQNKNIKEELKKNIINMNNKNFILECYLYNKEKNKSIKIIHLDGEHIISEFYLDSLKEKTIPYQNTLSCQDIFECLPHPFISKKLKFQNIWIPEKDELCANFEVLTKKATVFIGFKEGE